AYINTLRSSLDILATSLAARSGVCKPEDAYFPVARSETAFNAGNYKGSKFVKGLPGAERAIIEALKPYKGGNEPLYALHQLDIMRKHRRLIEVDLIPQGASASKGGFISTEAFREDEKTVLGFIRKRPPDSNGK